VLRKTFPVTVSVRVEDDIGQLVKLENVGLNPTGIV
jgi:hypothetical protein